LSTPPSRSRTRSDRGRCTRRGRGQPSDHLLPDSSARRRSATWTMPAGSDARFLGNPSARVPEQDDSRTPREHSRRASLVSDSKVCWTTPGSDRWVGSDIPPGRIGARSDRTGEHGLRDHLRRRSCLVAAASCGGNAISQPTAGPGYRDRATGRAVSDQMPDPPPERERRHLGLAPGRSG